LSLSNTFCSTEILCVSYTVHRTSHNSAACKPCPHFGPDHTILYLTTI
jgi:hypothetical protein